MRYTLLGTSGLRVPEACLGTMTFGEDWGWGASREESGRIFRRFTEAGGNFIDTSVNYTDGTSERFVGELIAEDRERYVVATKYTLTRRKDDPNAGGNHRKNMVASLEASLRRLGTEYVDVLYLHMWDYLTPIEEIMRALDDLIRAGKVLYAGISDTPAWVVARANMLADLRGWSPFVALQLPYSLGSRDPERELLPMARSLGLSVATWGILGGGVLTGKYHDGSDEPRRYGVVSVGPGSKTETVLAVARESGHTPAQVAIAWMLAQSERASIIPILRARTEGHMQENLAALDRGFPHTFLASPDVEELIFGSTRGQISARRWQQI